MTEMSKCLSKVSLVFEGEPPLILISVLKDLFPIDWNPATHGFSENNGYYERVYQVNELAEKTDDTSGDFVLQAGVPFDGTSVNVAGTQLFTKVEGALSFRCR